MKELKLLKYELQNVINGKGGQGESNLIQTAKAFIGSDTQTGGAFKETKRSKSEEERALRAFAVANNLLLSAGDLGTYITEGAEQKIFYHDTEGCLYKMADSIFYENWTDYFNNLLLHNYFFPDTAYTLTGFTDDGKSLYAVVKQVFVFNTESTNLETVKNYLLENGFQHKKNNDYFHPYLGVILEDLHDENVLINSGVLFFIDTVFYLTDEFYQKP